MKAIESERKVFWSQLFNKYQNAADEEDEEGAFSVDDPDDWDVDDEPNGDELVYEHNDAFKKLLARKEQDEDVQTMLTCPRLEAEEEGIDDMEDLEQTEAADREELEPEVRIDSRSLHCTQCGVDCDLPFVYWQGQIEPFRCMECLAVNMGHEDCDREECNVCLLLAKALLKRQRLSKAFKSGTLQICDDEDDDDA